MILNQETLISAISMIKYYLNREARDTWAPAGGSKGERSLPPGKKKKKV